MAFNFRKSNGKAVRFEGQAGDYRVRKPGFLVAQRNQQGGYNALTAEEASSIDGLTAVAFFPGLGIMSPGGKITLVPLNATAFAGELGDKKRWTQGSYAAVAEVIDDGEICTHLIYGFVGNREGQHGGFNTESPSMGRLGNEALESRILEKVSVMMGETWAYGRDFYPTEEGLQEVVNLLAAAAKRDINIDIEKPVEASTIQWVTTAGELVTHGSAREAAKKKYTAQREAAGTTRQDGTGDMQARVQAAREKYGIGRPQMMGESDDKAGNG